MVVPARVHLGTGIIGPKKRAQVSTVPGQLAAESMAPLYLKRKNRERQLYTKKNNERLNTQVQMLCYLKKELVTLRKFSCHLRKNFQQRKNVSSLQT